MEFPLWIPEIEEGNIEYKKFLLNPSKQKIDRLTSQMKWRLNEGLGEAIYVIGIEDNGYPVGISQKYLHETQSVIENIAKNLDCKTTIIADFPGYNGTIRKLLIRETKDDKYIDIRIAVCGEENSGKSTLIAVLNQGELDDGNGSMRIHCFNHLHEIETGKTSSISHQILGFDTTGKCVNDIPSTDNVFDNAITDENKLADIVDQSYKVISFIDLPGYGTYLKTTIHGLTSHFPDYCLLVIDVTKGITQYIKEQWSLINELNIPIIIALSKTDLYDLIEIDPIIEDIETYINVRKHKYKGIVIPDSSAEFVYQIDYIPIFLLSSVTGKGLDKFKLFLNLLPRHANWKIIEDKQKEFIIEQVYFVDGVGTIVSGAVTSGKILIGDKLLLGPGIHGEFEPVTVTSIYRNYRSVDIAQAGQFATCCLRNVADCQKIRRGMVLLDSKASPDSCWSFKATVTILYHKLDATKKYQPIVQCMSIRQPATMIHIKNVDSMKTSDRTEITFKFMQRPEYLKKGMRVIFNGNTCKGIGIISKIYKDLS